MKVRKGFVSNSSSTSFCIVGVQYSEEEYEKIEQQVFETPELCGTRITEYDPFTVGLHINKMLDTETLGEFKKRSLDLINKIDKTITIKDIGIHIDGGYDG